MDSILASTSALFLTMALVPALARFAGPLGLHDQPSTRKVHLHPTPRVGGIAVSLSVCLSILVWAPFQPITIGLITGGLWIALFGALDDVFDMHYIAKILGQIPAIAIAIYSGITFKYLPFFGLDPAPEWICIAVTAIFFLGITNAINLFDGLDGLAGGCVLVTLAVIAYLAVLVDGISVSLPAIVMIGAVLAFLNFNTHPARVFLGDAGSQFLGFSVAALAILLVGEVHTALNPAIPLLLLGLPILDTTWAFCRRIMRGRSPFKADRRHLHHQLLRSGLSHAQVVSFIYFFQVIFVGSAVLLRYSTDVTVVAFFFLESALFVAIMGFFRLRARDDLKSVSRELRHQSGSLMSMIDCRLRAHPWFLKRFNQVIELAVCFFVLIGVSIESFPKDISYVSLVLAVVVFVSPMLAVSWTRQIVRVGFYSASLLAVYNYAGLYHASVPATWVLNIFFGLLAVALFIGIRFINRGRFQVTPQDILVGLIALSIAAIPSELFSGRPLNSMAVFSVVLFYSCEYLISISGHRWRILVPFTALSLLVVAIFGINS